MNGEGKGDYSLMVAESEVAGVMDEGRAEESLYNGDLTQETRTHNHITHHVLQFAYPYLRLSILVVPDKGTTRIVTQKQGSQGSRNHDNLRFSLSLFI